MSNPGVIQLAHTIIGNNELRIEDNIGEAIHIHYGKIRLDFTIKEFLELASSLVDIAEKMIDVNGFSFKKFDAIFLSQIGDLLLNLERVEFKKCNIGELLTDAITEDGMELISMKDSRVSRALRGDTTIVKKWKQTNYFGEDNVERVNSIYQSIKELGYVPEKNAYIVVCDNGKYVVDGCHRCSAMYNLYGDVEVEISNWITKNNKYSDECRSRYYEVEKIQSLKWKKNRLWLVSMLLEKDLSGKKILFKGAGKHTIELLKLMEDKCYQIVGIIADEIKEDKLKKYKRISLNEIESIDADVILISSYKYRDEMKKELEAYVTKFEIYDLYENGIDKEFFS